MDKIFVVMPVINLWDEYTIHCMESIAAQVCEVETHVVIVDQASSDMTVVKAEDFGNRKMPGRVHVLHNDVNRGCAGGWNQGVQYAIEQGATHIFIANNDILLGPGALQALYNRMQTKEDRLTPCLVSCVDVIRELKVPQMVLDPNNEVNKKADTEALHPNFSGFMITPDTIKQIGWFDEGFFPAYFEDNDYHYRIKLAGAYAIANTTAVFIHYGSRTQNQSSSAPMVPGELFRKNADYFAQKWGGPPTRETFTKPFNHQDKDLTYAKRN